MKLPCTLCIEKKLLLEYVERLVRHICIQFGYHFKRGVHCQYGNANVDGVDVEVCHIEGNCAAAAKVHATEFAVLPDYLLVVETSGNVGSNAELTSALRHLLLLITVRPLLPRVSAMSSRKYLR